MKFNNEFAAIHGYLCSDGYVMNHNIVKNYKHYIIGFRNTKLILLRDFQKKFFNYFGVKPHLYPKERCALGSKMIHRQLTEEFSYYSREWRLPENLTKEQLRHWLRAYFDCDSSVCCQKAKNRNISLECVNFVGLHQIKHALLKFGIESNIRLRNTRKIYTLSIFKFKSLKLYRKYIGYLLPHKRKKLDEAIASYVSYDWQIPNSKKKLLRFIRTKGRPNISHKELRFNTIKKKNLLLFKNQLSKYTIRSKIYGPLISGTGSKYYALSIKDIYLKTLLL